MPFSIHHQPEYLLRRGGEYGRGGKLTSPYSAVGIFISIIERRRPESTAHQHGLVHIGLGKLVPTLDKIFAAQRFCFPSCVSNLVPMNSVEGEKNAF